LFELQRITAGYGGTTVLRGVSLAVPDGSVVTLLGANGAGKTTMLRVASGLLQPTSGCLAIDGKPVEDTTPHALVRQGICLVPEGRGVFRTLPVRENLTLQAPKGTEDESIARAVEAFPRLGERLAQAAGTMSGGEQQMLALARAYIQSPRVVLLDEVSMGLAPKVVDEIFTFLAGLAATGTSLLLVEQYVTRALEVADYVYMLNKGQLAFVGEPAELAGTDVFAAYVGANVGSS
jgi:branched-chain amino acid transport system ATP-binding protein